MSNVKRNLEQTTVNKTDVETAAATPVKPTIEKEKKPVEKKETASVEKDSLAEFKDKIRAKLNAIETLPELFKTAKKFGVDGTQYKKLNNGMQKMNTVNRCIGAVTLIFKESKSITDAKKKITRFFN